MLGLLSVCTWMRLYHLYASSSVVSQAWTTLVVGCPSACILCTRHRLISLCMKRKTASCIHTSIFIQRQLDKRERQFKQHTDDILYIHIHVIYTYHVHSSIYIHIYIYTYIYMYICIYIYIHIYIYTYICIHASWYLSYTQVRTRICLCARLNTYTPYSGGNNHCKGCYSRVDSFGWNVWGHGGFQREGSRIRIGRSVRHHTYMRKMHTYLHKCASLWGIIHTCVKCIPTDINARLCEASFIHA